MEHLTLKERLQSAGCGGNRRVLKVREASRETDDADIFAADYEKSILSSLSGGDLSLQ